jgi:hypothetical protein
VSLDTPDLRRARQPKVIAEAAEVDEDRSVHSLKGNQFVTVEWDNPLLERVAHNLPLRMGSP